ncbi:MAG: AI-2E family transporter [Chloroflexi bacterium]|nr:AI-2E family transporter [Chloroflexota bacterium]
MQRRLGDPVWRAHVLLPLVVLAGLLWIAWSAWDAVMPFLVGLVGAYAVYPLVIRLQSIHFGKRTMPRTMAVLLVYVAGIGLLVGFADLVLPPLFKQAGQLILSTPKYWDNLQVWQQRGLGWYNDAPLPPEVRAAIEKRVAELGPAALEWVQTTLLSLVGSTTKFLATAFGFLVIPLWMFYVLAEAEELGGELKQLVPYTWRSTLRDMARIADEVLGGYLALLDGPLAAAWAGAL